MGWGAGYSPSVDGRSVTEELLKTLELLNTGHLTASNTPVYSTISLVSPSANKSIPLVSNLRPPGVAVHIMGVRPIAMEIARTRLSEH